MKISILGTGMVGRTLAEKMTSLGHDVVLGTRNAASTIARSEVDRMTGISFSDWLKGNPKVQVKNYADLPTDTSLYFNATSGSGSAEALLAVGKDKLKGKTILDISNPLDFSKGMPPTLSVCNTDSLAEQLQREFADSHLVKSLNTMNCFLMMNPSLVPGDHSVFVSGNHAPAKQEVKNLLGSIGWKASNIIDLGDISTARGTEMLLPIWLRLWGALGSPNFNFHIAKA